MRESDGSELNSESNNSNLFEEPEENPWKINLSKHTSACVFKKEYCHRGFIIILK